MMVSVAQVLTVIPLLDIAMVVTHLKRHAPVMECVVQEFVIVIISVRNKNRNKLL